MDSIRTNFAELLAAFSSEDSMTILTAFLMTLLIGWLMRYFWDRWKIKSLEEKLDKAEQEKIRFKEMWQQLQEKYALQEADLKKVNLALADKSSTVETLEAEKRTLSSRLNTTLIDLDKTKESYQATSNRMEDLNDQILGLRTKNAQLGQELETKINTINTFTPNEDITQYQKEAADLAAENTILKNSIAALKANTNPEGTTAASLRITELEQENETLKDQIEKGLPSEASEETAALRTRLTVLEQENDKLEGYINDVVQLEDGNQILSTTIIDLLEENEALKTKVEALPQYEAGNDALNASMQALMDENDSLQGDKSSLIQYEAGNEVLNATITSLIQQNQALEEQLSDRSANQVEWTVSEVTEEKTLDTEEAKTKLRAAIGQQIARASSNERDDLKQINGIGPFIEEKLNDLGIYTFEQISQFDDEMIETLTAAIEFFPGRIEKDDWVGQADRLFYTLKSNPQEMQMTDGKILTRRYATATERIDAKPIVRTTAERSVKPDDLKKIEGIGPKIAQILNDAGIYTFANLSQTSSERLRNILDEAGNRYKMHDPKTWPQQAGLAAVGDWDKLKELQDALDGGREAAK